MIDERYKILVDFARNNDTPGILTGQDKNMVKLQPLDKSCPSKVGDPTIPMRADKEIYLMFHTVESVDIVLRALKRVKKHIKSTTKQDS